jgi:transcriptional regulator with XRE-family HTH domain
MMRLKELRGNETQAAFASKLNLRQATYSRYESGEREPDLELLCQIAKTCGVSADWLLGLTDTRTGAGPVVTATGGSAASGTGPATVHAPPAVAPPGPAETDRLLTIIESQQRVIENLSRRK